MLKSNSLFNDKEISISEQEMDDNIFINTQINKSEANKPSEIISRKFSLQNQSEKGLFSLSFPSANPNEDLISKLSCLDFIGKKRKLSDESFCEMEKDESEYYAQNSAMKSLKALARNENIMWINKNKNFKFAISKNQEANTESPLKILKRDRLGDANAKKAGFSSFNGESKITDFFKEKKKKFNLINNKISLNSIEAKEANLNVECYADLKNCTSQMKSNLLPKAEEKKHNFSANKKLKKINLASQNKMHNKNIIELYNLNKKTIMEEVDIDKPLALADNPDSVSTCDLLHDKLIFSGQNNFKNKINYFNLEGIKNNNNYNNQKNSIINFNYNNNDLSALNQLNNKKKKRIESSNLETSEDKPFFQNRCAKSVKFVKNFAMKDHANFINEDNLNEEMERKSEQNLSENLDLNENQDYNNIFGRRENANCESSIQKETQKEIALTSFKKDNINKNKTINLLENSFSNLILKDAQNIKTPSKREQNPEEKNAITSPFFIKNCFPNGNFDLEKTNSAINKEENKSDYEDFNKLNNADAKEKPKHNYYLRRQRRKNNEAPNKLNGDIKTRKMRFSLSKKKVMRKQNRMKKGFATHKIENKFLFYYFKQEKINNEAEVDNELIISPKKSKQFEGKFETNNDTSHEQLDYQNNSSIMISSSKKDKCVSQNLSTQNLNLNSNKKNQINKKMTASSTVKGKVIFINILNY